MKTLVVAIVATAALAVALLVNAAPRPGHPVRALRFHLENIEGFRVDSDSGLVTKDMVESPDTTIALRLGSAEMAAIRDTIRRVHLERVPEPCPPYADREGGSMAISRPASEWLLDVDLDGWHRRYAWTDERWLDETTPSWKALWRVVFEIRAVVERQPAYRGLPEPRGGYQ